MGRRRAKTKKVTPLESSSSSSDDDGNISSLDDNNGTSSTSGENQKEKRKKAVKVSAVSNDVLKRPRNAGNCVSAFESTSNDATQDEECSIIVDNDVAFKKQAPFCCATCHCPKNVVQKLQEVDEEFFQPGEGACWHRRCCHGHHFDHKKDNLEYWATSFLAAQEQGEKYLLVAATEPLSSTPAAAAAAGNDEHRPNTNPLHFDWITKRELQTQYNVARSQQAELYNDDGWESKFRSLY
jgi:hypothetical protein